MNLQPPPDDDAPRLGRVIRTNLLRLVISLVLLGILVAVLALYFGEQLDAVTAWAFETMGIGGLIALIFCTDAFVSPFPPDTVLILISASPYHEHWLWLIPAIGGVSSLAGCVGYYCGKALSRHRWATSIVLAIRSRGKNLIERFGPWAVVLGALTPIPFSITCWTAGIVRLPFVGFFIPCLLRIPRYAVYYAVIAYSSQLFH